MSMPNTVAIAVKKVSLGLLATIEACGQDGASDELLAIAMAPYGTTDRHCRFFVETMRSGGLIEADDQLCLRLTEQGRAVKSHLARELNQRTRVMH